MRTIFIADAHLKSPDNKKYQALCSFLSENSNEISELYIMGDLFDFWIGFPSADLSSLYRQIISIFEDLSKKGCSILYFEGNHDFHLGDVFENRLKAKIYTKAAVLTIQNKKIYLCHGDQLNKKDYGYRLLRFMLKNRLTKLSVNFFPTSLAYNIRKRLQKTSKKSYSAKKAKFNYESIIRAKAETLAKNGIDGMIIGHFHIPLSEILQKSAFSIMALGEWNETYYYGEMIDGKMYLKVYHPVD